MTTTRKVNQLSNLGTLQAGDTVVGERTSGTTGVFTVGTLSISDGDKGDITVSSSGTTWTIDVPTIATVATDDKVLIKDTSDSDATKYVTAQSIADLAAGGVTSVNGETGAVTLTSDDISDTAQAHKFVTATDITNLSNLSGTNTGDQTSIVGITGTKAEFDTAVTDGNFLYVGDVTQYNDEMAQDAVGAMVDSSLTYVDGTPLLQRAALTGDVTASAGSNSTTIANDAVTYAKIQNVSATDKLLGRSSSGAGDVEEIACTAAGRALIDDTDAAAQRTTLGLGTLATQSGTFSGTSSGTNTGDQNIFQTIAVSGQSDVVADSTTDTLTLAAGTAITLTTNASTDTVTITNAGVTSVAGTSNQISASAATGAVTLSIPNNPVLPGTQSVTLPQGSTASRPAAGTLGRIRANTSTGFFEYDNGSTWYLNTLSPETITASAVPKYSATNSPIMTVSGVTIDSSNNLATNNPLAGYTSTATAAGTTTLTVGSTYQQVFTGTTTQTCKLPAVSTLVLGTRYVITNLSTGVVTVQSSGANTIQAMASNTTLIIQSNATSGTGATVWNVVTYTSAASDITGSGSLVRATSPTFTTPVLGTPSSGTLTNCTGLPFTSVTATPKIYVNVSSSQSIATSTFTKVQLDNENYDTTNTFDNATNYRWTPTTAGKYLLTGSVYYSTPADGKLGYCLIYKNGSPTASNIFHTGSASDLSAVCVAIVDMNGSTDYIEMYCWHNHGSNRNISANTQLAGCMVI